MSPAAEAQQGAGILQWAAQALQWAGWEYSAVRQWVPGALGSLTLSSAGEGVPWSQHPLLQGQQLGEVLVCQETREVWCLVQSELQVTDVPDVQGAAGSVAGDSRK